MDIRKIKQLIALLESSDVAEIEIHEAEDSIRISRYSNSASSSPTHYGKVPHSTPAHVEQTTTQTQEVVTPARTMETENTKHHSVTSPMVGTFYVAPSPGLSLLLI